MDLLDLARWGDLDGVKKLIQQGVSVDSRSSSRCNQTALYVACENGQTKLVQYLLECGASVSLGAKPLITAVRNDHYECVELLLKHRASLHCTNTKGQSPMSVAEQKYNYCIILLLIQYGAIPPMSLSSGSVQLVKHARFEHAGAVTKLINNNIINLSSEDVYLAVFGYAFKSGIVELAQRMLSCDSYTDVEQLYPVAVYYSAKHNWSTVLSTLLLKQADINMVIEDQTPLYIACKEGHAAVVTLLLDNGADPNAPSKKDLQLPIQIAVHQANTAVFSWLVGKGAKLHHDSEPLLHTVCSPSTEWKSENSVQTRSTENVLSMISLLLQHRVAVNALSDKGDTALYRASKSQQLEVVQALIEAGADVNLSIKHLYPLIAACETGNAELINLLLNAGADATCTTSTGETCLSVVPQTSPTSNSNTAGTIESLLQHGVNVNSGGSQKTTALYRASEAGHEDIVRILLEAGAETNGSSSRRPLYAACEHGHSQIVDLLLRHDADSNLPRTLSNSPFSFLLGHFNPARSTLVSLPIYCSVQKGHTDIVNLLLKHGADVNKQESCGKSALIYIVELLSTCQSHLDTKSTTRATNFEILRSMLSTAGDINLSFTSDGLNPLHIASSSGRCDIMLELIQHGAQCNQLTRGGKSTVELACEKGHEEAVKLLLENGAKPGARRGMASSRTDLNINAPSNTPQSALCTAAKNNNETLVNMLLKNEADVNTKLRDNGNTALHLTTSDTIMETLLKAGADVNAVNDREETALSKVCSKKDASVTAVEMLLKCGADPNVRFPLHDACESNNTNIAQLLLKYGALPNGNKMSHKFSPSFHRDRIGNAPSVLCIACRNGNVPMVTDLLKSGAFVRFEHVDGRTPLHFAVERLEKQTDLRVHDPIVTLLLRHGAVVNVASGKEETPLYVACFKGHAGVVNQLLNCNAAVDLDSTWTMKSLKSPLLVACEENVRDIAIMVLNRGANPNVYQQEQTPLKYAVLNGHSDLVEKLICRGADVNQMKSKSETALHVAVVPGKGCKTADVNIVKYLLKNGADPTALNRHRVSPLHLACNQTKEINVDVIQALLEHGTDPNFCLSSSGSFFRSDKLYPLMIAAECINTRLIALLIKFGAKLDHKDSQGRTALHYAIEDVRGFDSSNRDTSGAELLLSAGAEVDVQDKIGVSPLYLACEGGKADLVKLLLNHDANPNTKTTKSKQCRYPIHAASNIQCYDVVKLLLKHKADVSVYDKNGKTALHYVLAAHVSGSTLNEKKTAIVQLLLNEAVIHINATSEDGETPLYVACSKGILSAVDMLLTRGARIDANLGEKSPLNAACRYEHLPVVQKLLNRGANPDLLEDTKTDRYREAMLPLAIASSIGSSEIVEMLLKHGANINVADRDGNTALHHATKRVSTRYSHKATSTNSKKSVIDILLENKANVNIVNHACETSLYIATSRGLLDIVRKMLESCGGNANESPSSKHPLTAACEKNDVELVNILLKHGADPNLGLTSGDTCMSDKFPLSAAFEKVSDEIVMSLLKAGAMVNVVDSHGKSIVCLAVDMLTKSYYPLTELEKKYVPMLRMLMEHGADLDVVTPDGHSLLHKVVTALSSASRPSDNKKGHLVEVIQLFVEYGACLLDFPSNLDPGASLRSPPQNVQTLRSLMTFDDEHSFLLELFQAGASFQLLTLCCDAVAVPQGRQSNVEVKSIRLCQAAVLAGYKPGAAELQDLQQGDAGGLMQQLLDWLNDDREQVPSLQRQCRVAIRQQLSTAAGFRTILPTIEKLPVPSDLKMYLQFGGRLTEVDLSIHQASTSAEQQKRQAQLISTVLHSGERNAVSTLSNFSDFIGYDRYDYDHYDSSDDDYFCYGSYDSDW